MSNDINIVRNVSMVESRLPAGFRFHPRDEELVCDYLFNKILNLTSSSSDINHYSSLFIHVDLNKSEPWEIPESACVGGKEWYFYSQRDRKYATGLRTNRATASGYWKATGKDRPVLRKGKGGGGTSLVGMRKTLVFYQGRAPKGRKTDWVMHEFRLEGSLASSRLSSLKEDWVLCRVFYKSREALPTNMNMSMNMNMNNNHMGASSNMISQSQSLPALMDAANYNNNNNNNNNNNYISFDDRSNHPTPHALIITSSHDRQQVSCFSNNIINNLPQNNSVALEDPYFSYGETENEVLQALLNQLTNPSLKSGSGSPLSLSMAEGTSEANVWTHF